MILNFFGNCVSYGQYAEVKENNIIRVSPSFTLQVNINYNRAILELSGAYNNNMRSEDIYTGNTFGSDKGFGASVVSKIGIGKSKTLRFNQVLSYNRILSYGYNENNSSADIGDANYNALSGALGLEYSFMPARVFRVYVGGEFNASMIDGDIKVWFERRENPLGDSVASYSVANSFRMGYGINAGAEYLINRNIGLNLGLKFMNLNAFNRKAEGSNDDKEFGLRDDYKQRLNFSGNKNFSFYSICGGVNFYFGVKK